MSLCQPLDQAGEGVGRSDNDRQFVFCNGRPVDMAKAVKIVNEVGLDTTASGNIIMNNNE